MFAMHLKSINPFDILEFLTDPLDFTDISNVYRSKTNKTLDQMDNICRNVNNIHNDIESDRFILRYRLDSCRSRPTTSNIRQSIRDGRQAWLFMTIIAVIANGLISYLLLRDRCRSVIDTLVDVRKFIDIFGDLNYFTMQFSKLYIASQASPPLAFDQVINRLLFKSKLQDFMDKRSLIDSRYFGSNTSFEIAPYSEIITKQKSSLQFRVGGFMDTVIEIIYRTSIVGSLISEGKLTPTKIDWSNVRYLSNFAYIQKEQRKILDDYYATKNRSLTNARIVSYMTLGIHLITVGLFTLIACSLILKGERMMVETLEVFSKFRRHLLLSSFVLT